MIGESPRKFESPIVIIDPIDRNRNLGAAISIQNVTNFILIARNFLRKNSISYFITSDFYFGKLKCCTPVIRKATVKSIIKSANPSKVE